MPYSETWTPPEIFFEYMGKTIYYTYNDDLISSGKSEHYFAVDPDGTQENGGSFDVRALKSFKDRINNLFVNCPLYVRKSTIEKIEQTLLWPENGFTRMLIENEISAGHKLIPDEEPIDKQTFPDYVKLRCPKCGHMFQFYVGRNTGLLMCKICGYKDDAKFFSAGS